MKSLVLVPLVSLLAGFALDADTATVRVVRDVPCQNKGSSKHTLDVYVPEGVDVDVAGITLFGRRREWGRDLAHTNTPIIHLRVLGLFATIDVWRVPHEMRGTYGELIKQLKQQQRQLPA